jgi:hypothetical protein
MYDAAKTLPLGEVPDVSDLHTFMTSCGVLCAKIKIPATITYCVVYRLHYPSSYRLVTNLEGWHQHDRRYAHQTSPRSDLLTRHIGALELFPDATVLHLGLFRDKATLQAIESVHPPSIYALYSSCASSGITRSYPQRSPQT